MEERIIEDSGLSYITRRTSLRVPYNKKVRYGLLRQRATNNETNNYNLSGHTFNLSEHGVGLATTRGFPPSSKLQVHLFTGNETLRLEGIVKWAMPSFPEKLWRVGIEFTSRTDNIKNIYKDISFTQQNQSDSDL